MNPDQDRLPSKPLRNWLLAWHIHTGDPAYVMAKGFDLDPILLADLLSGDVPLMIERSEALAICIRLRLAPTSLWSSVGRGQVDQSPAADAATSDVPSGLLEALGGVIRG